MRQDLLLKTREVNRVIATQGLSYEGACKAKAERDVTETFVKLQVGAIGTEHRVLDIGWCVGRSWLSNVEARADTVMCTHDAG